MARVLDLYAGTGAFALEAVSRGAEQAVMIDNGKTAYSLICRNIEQMYHQAPSISHMQPPLLAFREDLRKGVEKALNRHADVPKSFDIIFLDPPYDRGMAQKTLKDLDNTTLLAKDGLVIAEERSKVEITDEFTTLRLSGKRTYGDTSFWIFDGLRPKS